MISVGQRIPSITIKQATRGGAADINVEELCAGKRVVMFSVIGAFTSDCSEKHLPSYLAGLPDLLAKGIDVVACLAVNDVDVVRAWAQQHGALDKIVMLADGSALLTKALGVTLDLTPYGMGVRADRSVMVFDDGVLQSIAVEAPMQVDVSTAAACLRKLA
jgi:glutaredoxin/glutathione-dependent peroxiredoxin